MRRRLIAFMLIIVILFCIGCEPQNAYEKSLMAFEMAIKEIVSSDENLFLLAYQLVISENLPQATYNGERIFCKEDKIKLEDDTELENAALLNLIERIYKRTNCAAWSIYIFDSEVCIFRTTLKASKRDYFDCSIVYDIGNIHDGAEKSIQQTLGPFCTIVQ